MVNAVATFLDVSRGGWPGRHDSRRDAARDAQLRGSSRPHLPCGRGAAAARVEPEQRVALLLHDLPAFAAALLLRRHPNWCGRRAAEHAHDTRAGDRDPRRQPREGSGGRSPAARAPARRAGRTASSLRDRRNKA